MSVHLLGFLEKHEDLLLQIFGQLAQNFRPISCILNLPNCSFDLGIIIFENPIKVVLFLQENGCSEIDSQLGAEIYVFSSQFVFEDFVELI